MQTIVAHQNGADAGALRVLTIPAFKDNYLWLIHDGVHAAIVDPGDSEPVEAALNAHGLSLAAILLTHHHADHTGGVPALLARHAVPVFGPGNDGIASVTHPVGEGDSVFVAQLNLRLTVRAVPGHTRGHIAYVHAQEGNNWLFCGDTLFGGGCGRLFEGTPAQMAASLAKLAALPPSTLVYCAHEYTLSNLRFALAVEPDNDALVARMQADSAQRERGLPTVPSTILLEQRTNPFLRCGQETIERSLVAAGKLASGATPLQVFTALREWKNGF